MKSIIIQPSHVRGLGNILDNEDNIQGLHCRVEAQDTLVEFDDLELKTYYMGTGTQLNIRFILDTISILPEQTVHVDVLVTDDENNPVSGVDLYVYERDELISQMETGADGYGVEDGSLGFNFTSEDVGKHTLKCVIPRQDLYYESKNELVINVLQETTLTLTIDPDEIDTLTDTITLYGTLLNEEGEPVVGEIITFYDNATLLGWSITNDLGVATLVVNIEDIQDLGLVPYIGIDWIKTSDNPNNHTEDGSLYVSATISDTGIIGLPLTILVNNTVMFEGVTDSTGHADLLSTTLSENAVVTVITQHTNLYNATTKQYRLGETEKLPTTTSLAVSSSTVNVGTSVTFTATVLDEDDEPVEGLTVTFKDGGSSLGTGTTNSSGVATLSSSGLAAGNHSVTAETSEDNTYSGSTSTAVTVTVNKLATSTSLSLGSNTIYVDGSTTATATVTSGGNGVNGLTVTFKDGSTPLGTATTNSSGVATYTISGLNAGNHSITAVVTENSTYAASTSSAVTLTVNNHSYSLAFSAASYVATGGSATLECTLLDNNVPVEGATISVSGSDSSLYTGITDSTGVASVVVTGLNSTTTFTCSHSNVSDICTVIVQEIYIINDDASTDNTSTLFASSIPLRNSGTGSVAYNSGHYYVITNTKSSAEAFIELKALQGIYNRSFKVTTRTKNASTYKCPIALYYYVDSDNWGGVKDEQVYLWTSTKTNGVFTENSTNLSTSDTAEIISEFIFDANNNTLTVNQYVGTTLKGTKSMTIPVTLNGNVKWGTTTTWGRNTKRNLYEIKAEEL